MIIPHIVLLILLKVNSAEATAPWFDVAPNHTIMLSGFPQKGSYEPNIHDDH